MKRILGIDYGTVRIGLALSDPMQILASPLGTVDAQNTLEKSAAAVLQCAPLPALEAVVVGLPLLLSGKESATTQEVRAFADYVHKQSGLPLFFQDERLTSEEVRRVLVAKGVKRKKQTKQLDPLSATLILQTYLTKGALSKSP